MRGRAIAREALRLVPLYGIGALVAVGMKLFYRRAEVEDLDWILAPTSLLADVLGGIRFEREAGAGWVSHSHRMVLGPACAGVNFLIIVFAALFFSFVHRLRGPAVRGAWLGASLGLAYLVAVVANAIRIVAAVHLYGMDIYGELVTPERVHRVEGTVVYCVALLLACAGVEGLVERRAGRPARRRSGGALAPLCWYLGIALGAPLLSRANRGGDGRLIEHAGAVAAVCLLVALVWGMARRAARRASTRAGDHVPGGTRRSGC